jgi:HD domain
LFKKVILFESLTTGIFNGQAAQLQLLSDRYALSIELSEVLENFVMFCHENKMISPKHIQTLVEDEEHGFTHGINTVIEIMNIYHNDEALQNDPAITKEDLCLAALLHDVTGIKFKENGELVDLRDDHSETGSILIKNFLNSIYYFDNELICAAILNHSDDLLLKKIPIKEDTGFQFISAVRDADTIIEGMDILRTVKVTENIALNDNEGLPEPIYKTAYDLTITEWKRIAILMTEETLIRDSKENDLLMFLLRNVTKSIDPDQFVTQGAKKIMAKDMYSINMAKILEGLKIYKLPGNYSSDEQMVGVINEVVDLYRELKRKNLIKEAKAIVGKYTHKDRAYFDRHISEITDKLEALLK